MTDAGRYSRATVWGRGARLATMAAVFATLGACPAALARDTIVTSFDATPIVVHFYGASGLGAGERAPSVLVGAGYPNPGNTDPDRVRSDQIGVRTLRLAGYNVITWDARGVGGSGGTVQFNSPDFEGRDTQAIIDYVARQPEALLDGPGDPRVGMSGSSYGGAVQLVTAALDQRVDAIVPDVAWHSLPSSFFKEGRAKLGWFAGVICGAPAITASFAGGFFGPAGLQPGGLDTQIISACAETVVTGSPSGASVRWFDGRGPRSVLDRVRAPTLITQGTHDVLFPLGEGAATYEILRGNGVAVKMLWHCFGHGTCFTGTGQDAYVAQAGLAWLRRWLKRDTTVDTGPRFEWLADDAAWRSGPDFPLRSAGTVVAAGAGTLTLTPLDSVSSTQLLHATPAQNAVDVSFAQPPVGSDIVGAPAVELRYRGNALPSRTDLFAQVVDMRTNRVVGGQVTPIPVILDGQDRSVRRTLEMVSLRADAGARYKLQITPGTPVYATQRSVGTARVARVEASLPLVDASSPAGEPVAAPSHRRPRRLRIRVSSRREFGNVVRVVVRSKLRSRPCSGRVALRIRAGGRTRSLRTAVRRDCSVRAIVRLRLPRGTRARFAARFEGNSALQPRRAHGRVFRLR